MTLCDRVLQVIVSCLVAVAAGSTLQDPFIHESPQDQMAVASSVRGSTLQDPFLHVHREDQLAIATGVTGAKVAAPDTKKAVDRTPTARVPAPSLDDVIVLDGKWGKRGGAGFNDYIDAFMVKLKAKRLKAG